MENDFITNILNWAVQQGVAVVLICGIAYYFYNENRKLRIKLDDLNTKMMTYFEQDRKSVIEILEETTEALRQNTKIMQSIEKFIEKRFA